ncbi:MAG: AMP-binding protein, partial [Gammaproteobacteria bacterium]|nr:AMP-binding protein [Gammaproteobacteria bacterium]
VCTGGESLPGEVLRWAEEEFGVACNEFYGQTEFSDSIGCCKRLYATVPGSMGRVFPGHTVAIIDENGVEQPDETIGEVAAWAPDEPCLFLGYWGEEGLPNHMYVGNWLRSGDLAVRDKEGYFWYKGRTDDLIKSGGYRIGPNEVEEALLCHPDVAEAAVVGKPDFKRGTIVVAFIRVRDGVARDNQTRKELQQFVKNRLAFYKHPRIIEFVDEFPMTSSGKIRRGELRKIIMQVEDGNHERSIE